jgi:hypothetical protein
VVNIQPLLSIGHDEPCGAQVLQYDEVIPDVMIGVQALGERQGDDITEKALECWDDCGVDGSLVSKHWPTPEQLAPHETRGLLLGHHTLSEL